MNKISTLSPWKTMGTWLLTLPFTNSHGAIIWAHNFMFMILVTDYMGLQFCFYGFSDIIWGYNFTSMVPVTDYIGLVLFLWFWWQIIKISTASTREIFTIPSYVCLWSLKVFRNAIPTLRLPLPDTTSNTALPTATQLSCQHTTHTLTGVAQCHTTLHITKHTPH